MTMKFFSTCASLSLLVFGSHVLNGAEQGSLKASWGEIRALNYNSLPSDAQIHHRTKWSNNEFIYIDDDDAAPSFYVFDRSGQIKFSSMIQIPRVNEIRVDDFAAAADGSVWAGGHATSGTGQRTFFLAHVVSPGTDVQIIQINSYRPCQLTVASDGTVWTAGYGVSRDSSGQTRTDVNQDVLRRFDASGKLMASAMPGSSIDLMRARLGFLAANKDRVGWYSPTNGAGVYVEFSPDMKVLHSYPVVSLTRRGGFLEELSLTPTGQAFVAIMHSNHSTLYRLDRTTSAWVTVEGLQNTQGNVPRLEGNDGESLVFIDSITKSKLQLLDVSQTVIR